MSPEGEAIKSAQKKMAEEPYKGKNNSRERTDNVAATLDQILTLFQPVFFNRFSAGHSPFFRIAILMGYSRGARVISQPFFLCAMGVGA